MSLTSYNYYLQWSFISGVLTNILFSDHLPMRPHPNPAMPAIFTAVSGNANYKPRFFLVIASSQAKTAKVPQHPPTRLLTLHCPPVTTIASAMPGGRWVQVLPGRARVSCFSCRESKRSCDKSLPACHLCRRKGIDCRYPQHRGQKNPSPIDDGTNLDNFIAGKGSETIQSKKSQDLVNAEAIRFLAPDLFRDMNLQVPRLGWEMPTEIETQLGGRQQMQETTKAFLQLTKS